MLTNKINVLDKIEVPHPLSKVLSYLWEIQNLAEYEPKVSSVTVSPKSSKEGTYKARGFFAGIPWRGEFSYILREDGYFSQMLSKSYGVFVQGGFEVKATDKETSEVIHYENYKFPFWMMPLSPFI